MKQKIRVAIIDDHEVVRIGLEWSVKAFKDMEFVGSFADGEGAAAFVAKVKSDVTLLDIRMPHKDGVTALKEILERDPAAKVVILTTVGTEEDVSRCIELGAKGYVMKDGAAEKIIEAIRTVAAGGQYLPDEILDIYRLRQLREPLTARESDVLKLLAEGLQNRVIAERLGISEAGVKSHLVHICEKFGTKDRLETVLSAMRRGLVPPV